MKVKKKCRHHLLHVTPLTFFVTRNCQKTRKIDENVIIEREDLHIFQTTRGTSMKFSGKTWYNIKSYEKKQGFTLSLSRKYKFGKSYTYCKNLKQKKTFRDFWFFFLTLVIGQNRKVGNFVSFIFFFLTHFIILKFLSQFIFVVSEYWVATTVKI